MNCLNCNSAYHGPYCYGCGQKSTTKRLTVFSIVQDFITAMANTDRGLLKTIVDLSQDPGAMLNDYINGKRQRYFSAGKYTFLLVVVFTVNISAIENHFGFFEGLTKVVDTWSVSKTAKGSNIIVNPSQETDKIIKPVTAKDELHTLDLSLFGTKINKKVTDKQLLEFFKKLLPYYHNGFFEFLQMFIILWIPISTLFSYLIFFRSPFNFAEHLTVNSYIYAHILLVATIISPLYWLFPNIAGTTFITTLAAAFFYLVFAYMQVFRDRSYPLIKTFVALGSSSFVYIAVLSAGLFTLALYIGVKNIDLL